MLPLSTSVTLSAPVADAYLEGHCVMSVLAVTAPSSPTIPVTIAVVPSPKALGTGRSQITLRDAAFGLVSSAIEKTNGFAPGFQEPLSTGP